MTVDKNPKVNGTTIGDRIKSKRIELHMTQIELAKRIGVAKPTITRYETNVIPNIPLHKIHKLAEALGVTPEYLMGWNDIHPDEEISSYAPIVLSIVARYDLLSADKKDMFDRTIRYLFPELLTDELKEK